MKINRKAPAFTLLEMVLAMTVFTLFIGFSISTYLLFHRADQEALLERSLLMDLQGVMEILSEAVKANRIDYASYEETVSSLDSATLRLISPDGETRYVYAWDTVEETLSLQTFDSEGETMATEQLHGDSTLVTQVNFRIFPTEEAYGEYQPIVQIKLAFSVPGRVRDQIALNLQSSVTSRFYQ